MHLKMPGLQLFTESVNFSWYIKRLIPDHMVFIKDFKNTKADDKADDFSHQCH